jgi:YD repeat-containing protein
VLNLGGGTYTISYTSVAACTNFQDRGNVLEFCTGGGDPNAYYKSYLILPASLSLPDGRQYTFSYDSGKTPGHYGELTGITLPTGGTMAFSYALFSPDSGVTFQNRLSSVTVGSSTWNIVPSEVATGLSVTVTGPPRDLASGGTVRDDTVYSSDLANGLVSVIKKYSGSSSGSPVVTTSEGIQPLARTITTTLASGVSSKSVIAYVSNQNYSNLPQSKSDWDYGTTGSSTPTTQISYTYLQTAAYVSAHILNRPTSVSRYNHGTLLAQTNYSYDSTPLSTTSGSKNNSVTGSSNHDDANFGTSNTVRGNVTSISQMISPGTFITTRTNYYNILANLVKSVDANNNVTQYDYTDNWASGSSSGITGATFAFQTLTTSLVSGGVNQSVTKSFNGFDGSLSSVADQNDTNNGLVGTSYVYDTMQRTTAISYSDGGHTQIDFGGSALPEIDTTTVTQTAGSSVIRSETLDGIGRGSVSTLVSDPEGADSVSTTYDSLGLVKTVSNPQRSASSPTDGTATYFHDALGRVLSVVQPDRSGTTNDYSNFPCTTVTDEVGSVRRSCEDIFGRVTGVWEDPNGKNYETDYTYDALDNLLSVTQKGGTTTSSLWRTRTFTYDGRSRLLTASNPESGTITYTYDNNGNVITKTAPMPNQIGSATVATAYTYDQLNRLTNKSYSDGITPWNHYVYDVTPSFATGLTNIIGRLTWSYNQFGGVTGQGTASIYSYDAMGRPTLHVQQTPSIAPYGFFLNYAYDLAGNLTTNVLYCLASTFPGCTPRFQTGTNLTFTHDGASRPTTITSSLNDTEHPPTLYTVDPSVGYWPTGALRKAQFGNKLTEALAFNNRLQPCRMNVNSTAAYFSQCTDGTPSGNILDLTMGYKSGTNNGNVASWSAVGHQTFNRTYAYDSLNRIQSMADSATSQPCQGMSWTIDAWGNMTNQTGTKGTCYNLSASVGTNNRFQGGYLYDAAGNMTYDGSHHYTYDAENRIIAVDSGEWSACAKDHGSKFHGVYLRAEWRSAS